MRKRPTTPFVLILALALIMTAGVEPLLAARPANAGNNKMDLILERLDELEAKMDEPSTTATFCISQGRGLELGADWALESKLEIEGGLGWAEVLDGKVVWAPSAPVPYPIPSPLPPGFIPVPLPTEVKVGVAGGIGRLVDICIELPVTLSPEDMNQLERIAEDINSKTGDGFGEKGKYQRRAGRLLNYAALRVPGNQQFPTARFGIDAFEASQEREIEFDRADMAVDSLLDGGLGEGAEGMDAFRDQNVRELLATLEIPTDVDRVLDDPERIFDGLPDVSNGIDNISCDDLGVTAGMRDRRPRIDGICEQVETLPSFDTVRDAFQKVGELPDEILDAVAELMNPVLSDVGENAGDTKARFCRSPVGSRPAFDRYCNRN